ncbi:MAG: phosphoribosylaminoimidazolesuccinocarboxamide synthase [Planctomycetes bacterium]|nr:phosphoribosylaminoimidazolesuccinocarboxamide synthase [Planctomycetota bacterium]
MSTSPVVTRTDLAGLELLGRGKVRDLYRIPGDDERLVIVTTDRISAFDVILPNGIPDKGRVLTAVSEFWFRKLASVVPNHLITANVDEMPEAVRRHADVLRGRTMLVKKCEAFAVECVVRGYLAGSGLKDYRATGRVCGIPLPAGLRESDRLPYPVFTPSTKADVGEHDENIDFGRMAKIVGTDTAAKLRDVTLELFQKAGDFAESRGVILCDTKFEFGTVGGQITLIDEALTPDSSRYWDAKMYEPGKSQPSFDKQPVRDWLEASGWGKKPPAPELPPEVVRETTSRYREIYKRLTGQDLR